MKCCIVPIESIWPHGMQVRGHIYRPKQAPIRMPKGLPQSPGIGLRRVGGFEYPLEDLPF